MYVVLAGREKSHLRGSHLSVSWHWNKVFSAIYLDLYYMFIQSTVKLGDIFLVQYSALLDRFVTTAVSQKTAGTAAFLLGARSQGHNALLLSNVWLSPSRAPLLLLFCLTPPLPPVLRLLHHPALLRSSLRMPPSRRRVVRHPSMQRCLPSSTRAWI